MVLKSEILAILKELGVVGAEDACCEPCSSDKSGASCERAAVKPAGPTGKGRLFISEYEVRRRLTENGTPLKLPRGAILSPLAQDWLGFKGIDIIWE